MGFSHELRRAPGHDTFSFLRGASSAQELFETAKALGVQALGIVDRNSLAGIVRALEASRATGVRLVVGCLLDLADGMSLLVYPMDRPAYSRLTRLITLGKSRGSKNNCILHWDDVVAYSEGVIGILVPDLPTILARCSCARWRTLPGQGCNTRCRQGAWPA